MIVTTRPEPPLTAADLLVLIEHLGGIDPKRVRLNPPPGTATEDDLLNLVERQDIRCELIDGTLVGKPVMGLEETFLAADLIELLGAFVRSRRLGRLASAQAPLRMFEGNVRMPDICFVDAAQYRAWQRHRPAIGDFSPALAIEILSKSNTRAEMARKRHEYFESGTRLVWEINPRRKTVSVYTSATKRRVLAASQVLDGGNVLPGFRLQLRELFGDRSNTDR